MTLQRPYAEQIAVISGWQGVCLVNDKRMRKPWDLMMGHCGEVAKSVRVGQRTVFAESFLIVASLNVIKASRIAAIVPRVDAPPRVKFHTKRVATSLSEYFVVP